MNEFVQITRQGKLAEEEFYPMVNRMYETLWQQLLPPQIPTDGLTSRVKNNIVTLANAATPDCQTCGACCVSHPCVGIRPSENVDSDRFWNVTAEIDGNEIVVDRYMRRDAETFACVALEGDLRVHVACTIYENRPLTCRQIEAGSDRCHAIRRAFGIEPFLSLNEMSEAMEKLDGRQDGREPSTVIRNAQIRPDNETGVYVIKALMKTGELREIHRYDPERETWMQFEFDGLTLDEAEKLIRSRSPKTSPN